VLKIWKHQDSDHHREAHEMLYILPKQTRDVGEQLDDDHATQSLEIENFC